MKEKTFIISVSFFKTSLLVHFGDKKSYIKQIENYELTEDEKEQIVNGVYAKPCNGMVSILNDGKIAVWLNFEPRKQFSIKNIGTISHECLHVAYGMMEWVGVQTDDNEELMCMAQQEVFEAILNEVKNG